MDLCGVSLVQTRNISFRVFDCGQKKNKEKDASKVMIIATEIKLIIQMNIRIDITLPVLDEKAK